TSARREQAFEAPHGDAVQLLGETKDEQAFVFGAIDRKPQHRRVRLQSRDDLWRKPLAVELIDDLNERDLVVLGTTQIKRHATTRAVVDHCATPRSLEHPRIRQEYALRVCSESARRTRNGSLQAAGRSAHRCPNRHSTLS